MSPSILNKVTRASLKESILKSQQSIKYPLEEVALIDLSTGAYRLRWLNKMDYFKSLKFMQELQPDQSSGTSKRQKHHLNLEKYLVDLNKVKNQIDFM